ncbi:hypothetical protein [Actinomadura sp. WMMB 499]|uniref:hypothetical protein n=1 Tax=Actinomadura sp. WMMB 499 TaxID=1219491 RepID=UPI00159D660E|nr:hypothetical protein [Actinomadura sp. WMMB 499]
MTVIDPGQVAFRWFPLVARTRPRCSPLDVRVTELCTLADAAARNLDRAAASTVLNQAALLASDVGLHDLARDWCHQHAATYLRRVPLDAASARRALEPFVNLARLHIRTGNGDQALRLLGDLYRAIATRRDTTIDGHPLPSSSLTRSSADYQQLHQWLWTVNLADGTRALTTAGRWNNTLAHLQQHNGVGRRMLDGRQVAVIAHALDGDPEGAQTLLAETAPGEPWENAVTACLTVLCGTAATPDTSTLLDYSLTIDSPPGLVVFDTRLRLSVLAALHDTEHSIGALATRAVTQAIDARDGYAARDVLSNDACAASMTSRQERDLTHVVETCGLGSGTIPRTLHTALSKALTTSKALLASRDCKVFGSVRHSTLSHTRW